MFDLFSTVIVSGVHSGPDPSPGLGLAKSIKQAYPHLHLIGKDYSLRSSGLHDPVFDDIQVMPAWSEMSLTAHEQLIAAQLADLDGVYISGLDAEIDWLATLDLPRSAILNPNGAALTQIQKPRIACADALGMRTPDFLPATAAQADLHSLARRSGWRVWVKGKFHEAYAAGSLREMVVRLGQMQASWPIEDIFVQRGIQGLERSYTFAAYEGQLLGVAEVAKCSQTAAGKTWAADVCRPQEDVIEKIAAFVQHTAWTGGCEVEFIRDKAGRDWLIDVNPRFPAYIHGVTLCGLNLPARLLAAAARIDQAVQAPFGGQFTRVVSEVVVHAHSRIPPPSNSQASAAVSQKHPSFQPALVSKRRDEVSQRPGKRRPLSDRSSLLLVPPTAATRVRASDNASIARALRPIETLVQSLAQRLRVTPALSIKTDPQGFLAQAYLARGWFAEAISAEELTWARQQGFKPQQLILNGPVAASVAAAANHPVRYAFADSLSALQALSRSTRQGALGLRIRPSKIPSRFGIDLTDYPTYTAVLDTVASRGPGQGLAIHFHLPADQIGPEMWLDCFDETMTWASTIVRETGAQIQAVDIGGGWHSDDLTQILLPLIRDEVAARVLELAPNAELILEPGKAVSSALAHLATTIVEVRDQGSPEHCLDDQVDVLVDCSIADLPMAQYYAHRIGHYRDGKFLGVLSGGMSRVLGSICMESDVLATGVAFAQFPQCGDQLIFEGAGAYNSSMAWPFARGTTRD